MKLTSNKCTRVRSWWCSCRRVLSFPRPLLQTHLISNQPYCEYSFLYMHNSFEKISWPQVLCWLFNPLKTTTAYNDTQIQVQCVPKSNFINQHLKYNDIVKTYIIFLWLVRTGPLLSPSPSIYYASHRRKLQTAGIILMFSWPPNDHLYLQKSIASLAEKTLLAFLNIFQSFSLVCNHSAQLFLYLLFQHNDDVTFLLPRSILL